MSKEQKAKQTTGEQQEKKRKAKEDYKLGYYLTDDGLTLLRAYARDGLTYKQMAEKIGVSEAGFSLFRKKYPEVAEALSQTRELVDFMVENALLKSALGYKTREVKTKLSKPDKFGNRHTEVETIEKEIAPNPTSIAIWLNNRQPEKWKRNRDNDNPQLANMAKGITVNIIKHGEENYTATAQEEDDDEWED